LLVLTDSSLEDTAQRLEQIRTMFKDMKIRHHEQLLGMVTMSAGIVVADHGMTAGDVLRAADKALYAAKQSGSDQVAIYQAGE
jgi:diguanylate cyclase (GGDEF)-like protein